MESTGSVWNTSTGSPNRPNTSCEWLWRTGRAGTCLQNTTASTWNQRATGTASVWVFTKAPQGTPCHGTTTRPSPLWIGTRTATRVCSCSKASWSVVLLKNAHARPFSSTLFSGNCAHYQKGGWWYHMCAHSNLNGVWYRGGHYRSRYQDGVYWAEFHGGSYSLKKVSMMIKPT